MDIRHDQKQKKFIGCESDDCGYVAYDDSADGQLKVLSTFVPAELRGGGRAAELTRYVLSYARDNSLKVDPVCSYTQQFLKRHAKQYQDLVA